MNIYIIISYFAISLSCSFSLNISLSLPPSLTLLCLYLFLSLSTPSSLIILNRASHLFCAEGNFFSPSETLPRTYSFPLSLSCNSPSLSICHSLFRSSSSNNTSSGWTASRLHLQLMETDSPVAVFCFSLLPLLPSSSVACWFIQRFRGVNSQAAVSQNAAGGEDSRRNSLRCCKKKNKVMPMVV